MNIESNTVENSMQPAIIAYYMLWLFFFIYQIIKNKMYENNINSN